MSTATASPITEADSPDSPDSSITEITSLDDLRSLAETVQTTNRPRLVSIAGGGQITLAPPPKKRRRRTPEEKAIADEKAFLSSAGGWKGLVDPDEFMSRVREGRSSNRPPVVFPSFSEADESNR